MLNFIDLGLWHCEPGKYYERLPRWRYNVHAHGISRMVWQRTRCRKTEWIHGKILTILHNSKTLSSEAFLVSYPYFYFMTFEHKLTGTVKKLDESIGSYKAKNIFTTRKTCNLRVFSRASEIGAWHNILYSRCAFCDGTTNEFHCKWNFPRARKWRWTLWTSYKALQSCFCSCASRTRLLYRQWHVVYNYTNKLSKKGKKIILNW